ncbi:hypothetical protein EDD16DRAFT_1222844 [Pisolithus croceorrhizus]|nr:hypothetical protein EDD16DRAFT_1222844 [Pisolithus croceorrhizus]KAI6128026.1 hypothetical protein EV401DRAFT_942952 [Pisolithus croceorrhizus]KAI6142263.1 hypothetical protein EDD17DRAFT_253176 [Pisolithus thermaeus]
MAPRAMDELAAARAELARLNEREKKLLEELGKVRVAAQVQRNRIDGLFKKQKFPAPINRLPSTALCDIIYRVICDTRPEADAHRRTKRQLASVSRRWRDTILNFTNIWTTIVLNPSWSAALVMAHVDRSRECLLDIIITSWSSLGQLLSLQDQLGLVLTCGYRWRSLIIRGNAFEVSTHIVKSLIWNMRFPTLKRAEISGAAISDFPPFLTSKYASALQSLSLLEENGTDQVPAATNIKVVHFHLAGDSSGSRLLSSLLPFQQLKELALHGSGYKWPKPKSIHLPVLASLTLRLSNPKPALAAMVVPNLNHLGCSRPDVGNWANVFGSLPDKLANVRSLRLIDSAGPSSLRTEISSAEDVCMTFPGVRHAELPANEIPFFFYDEDDAPANYWSCLEGLTFKGLTVGTIPYNLVQWLEKRSRGQHAPLHVTFSEFRVTKSLPDSRWLPSLYKSVRGRCVLELRDVPVTTTVKALPSSQKGVMDSFGNRGPVRVFIDELFEG